MLGVLLVDDQIALITQASIKNKWTCWRSIYPYTWAVWQKSSYQHFAEYVNALEHAIVLDLGTGIGACIPLLKLKPSTRIIFTDPDSVSLSQAQTVSNESSKQFTFDVLDAKSAIEKYSTATHVSLLHVYSVLPDPLILLEQCRRQVPQALLLIYLSKFNGIPWLNFLSSAFGFAQIDRALLEAQFSVSPVGRSNLVFQGCA